MGGPAHDPILRFTKDSWKHQAISISGLKRHFTKETAWWLHQTFSHRSRSQDITQETSCSLVVCSSRIGHCLLLSTPLRFCWGVQLTINGMHSEIYALCKTIHVQPELQTHENFPAMKSTRCITEGRNMYGLPLWTICARMYIGKCIDYVHIYFRSVSRVPELTRYCWTPWSLPETTIGLHFGSVVLFRRCSEALHINSDEFRETKNYLWLRPSVIPRIIVEKVWP